MKKFLALATLLVVLLALPLTAAAERSGWKSNTFPFKNVKVVYLKDLSHLNVRKCGLIGGKFFA